ncbi:hypothetical protein NO108_00068 [Planktothrix rubescens]|nr:hypothetical protein NO108_00068 [Planktothrix rubescens]
MNTSNSLIFTNGINGDTGDYLLPPLTPEQISKYALGETFNPNALNELQEKHYWVQNKSAGGDFEDVGNLSETGWGVIFAHGTDPAIRDALSELLNHRKRQATQQNERFYREFIGVNAYRLGESKNDFLGRHNVGPGLVDPKKGVPYYLLIVGDPQIIPFEFQYQLDVQFAVGRIYFDTLDEYARYAHSVVMAETGQVPLSRRASFFGVQNPDDQATKDSGDYLVKPIATNLAQNYQDWTVQTLLGKDTTKARLSQLLGGSETPSFLFSASHGMGFANGAPRQIRHQGALLCQDWPGVLQWKHPIPEEFYFSADDISSSGNVQGLIAFFFACFGAGTPELDDFAYRKNNKYRDAIAPRPFVARLPQKLLSHPKGGALAVIGHVERAWGCSFLWQRAGQQLAVFETALKYIMTGKPVGAAMEWFNNRYAELSCMLAHELNEINYGQQVEAWKLADLWTANHDARSYTIVGDPAVRLPFGEDVSTQDQPSNLSVVHLPSASKPQTTPESESQLETIVKAKQELSASLEKFINVAQGTTQPQVQEVLLEAQSLQSKLGQINP